MNTKSEIEVVKQTGLLKVIEGSELLGVAGGVMPELDENGNIVRTCTDLRSPYPALSAFKRYGFTY